jgi:mannose-6-phosphate isomerase-like protein (cupin superfamily)
MNEAAPRAQAPFCSAAVRYTVGEKDARPWGSWEVIAIGSNYTLKRINVHAGARLSLQYHEFRAAHWTIVDGLAEVEIDGEVRPAFAGDHVVVPLRTPHRIKNIGGRSLTFIEVQMG